MAYSTQKDLFVVNFFNFKYEARCSPLSNVIKLHGFCAITDNRAFSMCTQVNAKYLGDLVACRNYVVSSPCDDFAKEKLFESSHDYEFIKDQPMFKLCSENRILKQKILACTEEIEQLNCVNQHLKSCAAIPKTKIKYLSIFNKIKSLYEDAKISNDDQNELLLLANNFCMDIKALQEEINRLKSGSTFTLLKDDKQSQNKKVENIKNTKNENNLQISKKSVGKEKKNNNKLSNESLMTDLQSNNVRAEKLNCLNYKIEILRKRAMEADRLESHLTCLQNQISLVQKTAQNQMISLAAENQKLKNHLKYAELEKKKKEMLTCKLQSLQKENYFLKEKICEIDDLKEALLNQVQYVMKTKLCNQKLKELINENDQARLIQNLENELLCCKNQNMRNEGILSQFQEQYKNLMECLNKQKNKN